jgi:hypothetical protein
MDPGWSSVANICNDGNGFYNRKVFDQLNKSQLLKERPCTKLLTLNKAQVSLWLLQARI